MICPYLINLRRDRRLHASFKGNLIRFSAINEDQNDGYCLVHAINTTDSSSLDDRCFGDYHLHYKFRDHSSRRVTFAISESIEQFVRVFPVKRYCSYRVLVFPNFAAISSSEYCTRRFMSEKEPLEDIVR